jgi:hypothetical protein
MNWGDFLHRCFWTGIEAWVAVILGLALAEATGFGDITMGHLEAATVAALAAVLTALKEFARYRLNSLDFNSEAGE